MSNQSFESTPNPQHWAVRTIGLPWVAGARGPDAYDCWGLFLAIQRCHFARDLPEIPVNADDLRAVLGAFRDHPERQRWQNVAYTKDHAQEIKLRRCY